MDWEKALFLFLLAVTVAASLRGLLAPAPPAARVELLLHETHRELAEIQRLGTTLFRTQGEMHTALARAAELALAARAKLDHLAQMWAELPCTQPLVVWVREGEDLVVEVWNVEAGGLAVGAGGPALRYDPDQWTPLEIAPAPGWQLTCSELAPGDLRWIALSPKGRSGPVVRIRGRGVPVFWVNPAYIQLVDAHNRPVEPAVVLVARKRS